MISLLRAIIDKFKEGEGTSTSVWGRTNGRVFLNPGPMMPDSISSPSVTFSIRSAKRSRRMVTNVLERIATNRNIGDRLIEVVFSVWSKSADVNEAITIGNLIEILLDTQTLTFSNADWVCRYMREIDGPLVEREPPYWVWTATFSIALEKL